MCLSDRVKASFRFRSIFHCMCVGISIRLVLKKIRLSIQVEGNGSFSPIILLQCLNLHLGRKLDNVIRVSCAAPRGELKSIVPQSNRVRGLFLLSPRTTLSLSPGCIDWVVNLNLQPEPTYSLNLHTCKIYKSFAR